MKSIDPKLPSMPKNTTTFKDAQQRDITIQRWGDDGLVQLRAYDNAVGKVPDTPDIGQAGMANLNIEHSPDGLTHVRLQDIVIPQDYRNSGISSKFLEQTVDIAKAKGAENIYGVIEDDEALNYWKHLEGKDTGWKVQQDHTAYGTVRFDLQGVNLNQLPKSQEIEQAEQNSEASTEPHNEDQEKDYYQGYSY